MSDEWGESVPRLHVLGDSCLAVRFGSRIDPVVNARCISLGDSLEQLALTGIRDVVPTFNAVTVHFDPLRLDGEVLRTEISRLIAAPPRAAGTETRSIEIPVSYGGDSGPDLEAVAGFAQCSQDEVVRRHTRARYRVYMLGFLPGFAYMGSVDPRIAMPRLDAPRMRVAAGSVGIAAAQTGIYPCESPGGWRIIGRTSAAMFDAARSEPCFLRAGDHVTFVAV